jgi:3-hydroxymyristoyl/3-hydroxydecanoyl-(acyl carrier protein) dehydratase
MAQALIVLYWYNFELENLFFLARDESRFHSPVVPGDALRIVASKRRFRKLMGKGEAQIWIGDRLCAESAITYASSGEEL